MGLIYLYHSPFTLFLLGQNVSFSTVFSNVLILCSSLSVRDGFPHQYREETKLLHVLSIPESGCRDSSIGIVTRDGLDGPGFEPF